MWFRGKGETAWGGGTLKKAPVLDRPKKTDNNMRLRNRGEQ